MNIYQYVSPIGILNIICNEKELLSLTISSNSKREKIPTSPETPLILKIIQWLDLYFQGINPNFSVPMNPKGTLFQKLVWQELQTIPYSKSITYQQLANRIASKLKKEKMSPQAIGQAVSKNPILIFIPCHRVLGKNKKLTGFSAGLDIKRKLLEQEQIPYQE